MHKYPEPLKKLVEQLMKLPGVGRKTADRLAFHIVRMLPSEAMRLSQAIHEVTSQLQLCSDCQFN